jgi:hypothetical protein
MSTKKFILYMLGAVLWVPVGLLIMTIFLFIIILTGVYSDPTINQNNSENRVDN